MNKLYYVIALFLAIMFFSSFVADLRQTRSLQTKGNQAPALVSSQYLDLQTQNNNQSADQTNGNPTPVLPAPSNNQTTKGANDDGNATSGGSAGIMWVAPSRVSFPNDSVTMGYKFNVTVWLNMTQGIFFYQVVLDYNRSQLKCDRVGFTDGGTSEYFTRHYSAAQVAFDPGFLGSGSILAYECCSNPDYVSGPRVASLIWLEFEVVSVPSGNMSFSSKFDITTEYHEETWVWDRSGNNMQIALHDGNYQILGSDVSAGLTGASVQSNSASNSISWNMPCAVPERRRQIFAIGNANKKSASLDTSHNDS